MGSAGLNWRYVIVFNHFKYNKLNKPLCYIIKPAKIGVFCVFFLVSACAFAKICQNPSMRAADKSWQKCDVIGRTRLPGPEMHSSGKKVDRSPTPRARILSPLARSRVRNSYMSSQTHFGLVSCVLPLTRGRAGQLAWRVPFAWFRVASYKFKM